MFILVGQRFVLVELEEKIEIITINNILNNINILNKKMEELYNYLQELIKLIDDSEYLNEKQQEIIKSEPYKRINFFLKLSNTKLIIKKTFINYFKIIKYC